jgi:hypothetical protein
MFEDMVNIHQLLIDLMLEVMVQYYIQMYRKKLPMKQKRKSNGKLKIRTRLLAIVFSK